MSISLRAPRLRCHRTEWLALTGRDPAKGPLVLPLGLSSTAIALQRLQLHLRPLALPPLSDVGSCLSLGGLCGCLTL
eukprot:scaffold305713_cov31-Tisochrysis_lutea.AAC.1